MEGHDNAEDRRPLKLYFIPYLASGHMIPTGDIARYFASRGEHVTIITTPSNAQLFLSSNSDSNQHFRVQTFQFPSEEVGLPAGVENVSATANLEASFKIYDGIVLLQGPIQRFMERDPPDFIIADFLCPWVHDIADNLGIPLFVFNGFPLFTICAMDSVRSHRIQPSGPFEVPDIPHSITMNAKPPLFARGFIEPLLEAEVKSHGLIVNSFVELEGEEYVHHYERTTGGHKVWHLGPACLARRTAQEKAERGPEKSVVSAQECLSWLSTKRPNSVVYISFGTVCYFPEKQLYEIACGVEASGCDFIWVVPEKKGKEKNENEKWVPKGFDDEKKGMIIRGWAPQLVILEHPAVGAILTHCGWNSTLEALCAGLPMITWPVHSDQFYNERLICDVRGIGVAVGVDEWCDIGFGEREKLVGREAIEKAVRRLMDGGDEAREIRRRAQEFGNKARRAVEEGGSSHQNLTNLIHHLRSAFFRGDRMTFLYSADK